MDNNKEPSRRNIRQATPEDKEIIFIWRNSDFLVSRGATKKSVTWSEHSAWFDQVMNDREIELYILEEDGKPVGQLRFEEIMESRYVVTIYLIESHIGRGLGSWYLNKGIDNIIVRDSKAEFEAIIRQENIESITLFRKLGFEIIEQDKKSSFGVSANVRLFKKATKRKEFNLDLLKEFYAKNVQEHLNEVGSLAWGSTESQYKRFKVLAQIGNINGSRILDVGCGLGDFGYWLSQNKYVYDYTGFDISKEMILQAQRKYPDLYFEVADILRMDEGERKFDYVFASGIFNRKIPDHIDFVHAMIEKMYKLSRKGLAFNILSEHANRKEPDEYYASPNELRTYCERMSARVSLDHEYMSHDFTIYMYR